MAIRRVRADLWLEADTEAKTLHLVIETPATAGEGDVEVYRVDLTGAISGSGNAEKRRKLRDAFVAPSEP